MKPNERTVLWLCAAIAGAGAAYVIWPLVPSLILGAWLARLARPVERWIVARFGLRSRAAAVTTTLLVLSFVVPIAGVLVAASAAAVDLASAVRASPGARSALAALVTARGTDGGSPLASVSAFIHDYGGQAWGIVSAVFRGVGGASLRLLVLVLVVYARLAHGADVERYFVDRIPAPRRFLDRLVHAFDETGRALLVGMGGTALLQGAVATVAFTLLGIPNAPVLGALTVLGAFVPAIGTALVWGPVAIGLALADRWGASIAMLAIGLGLIGMLDNVVRPLLTRRAASQLPAPVLLIAMIGGLLALGFAGVVLGPLVVRLGSEMLDIVRDGSTPDEEVACAGGSRPAGEGAVQRCVVRRRRPQAHRARVPARRE